MTSVRDPETAEKKYGGSDRRAHPHCSSLVIQRDISANMRRSVEACLEVGRGLTVLRAACDHGSFTARLDVLWIEPRVAQRFMATSRKFSNATTSSLLKAAGTQSKLFEMLVLDDEQLEELELTGQTGELKLDDVASMSQKELRAALRELRKEKTAVEKLPPDETLIVSWRCWAALTYRINTTPILASKDLAFCARSRASKSFAVVSSAVDSHCLLMSRSKMRMNSFACAATCS